VALDAQFHHSNDASWFKKIVAGLGKAVAWLTVLMVVVTFTVVILRYGFNLGWIWLQESVTYLHAIVFMLAAAWALQTDDHVRVDIFYRDRTPRQKAMVDLLGTVFLLVPVCVFLVFVSWDYVMGSWAVLEGSRHAGGLPLVYLQKTLILLLPIFLLLQAWVDIQETIRVLRQGSETPV
jgi:TRAP-type mannitol/chloroaromatic compound transport system permease small subunit